MKVEEIKDLFSDLSDIEKANFLARLAFELTIVARETYEVGTDNLEFPQEMRIINEIQHRILNYLSALLKNATDKNKFNSYGKEVLWSVILEQSDE